MKPDALYPAHEYVKKLSDGFYQITKTLVVYSKHIPSDFVYVGKACSIAAGFISIHPGFIYDGATFIHDGKKDKNGIPYNYVATALHDVLQYEKFYAFGAHNEKMEPITYKIIDNVLEEQLIRLRAWYHNLWYRGVRLYSYFFLEKR